MINMFLQPTILMISNLMIHKLIIPYQDIFKGMIMIMLFQLMKINSRIFFFRKEYMNT